jgi:hypothetical protein
MIVYKCQYCGKIFGNKKDHYDRHLNRKKPCVKILDIISEIAPENPPIKQETDNNKPKEMFCQFCNLTFTRNFSLNRHLQGRCKVNKASKLKNMKEDKLNLELVNKKIEETIDDKMNLIIEKQKLLKKENEKLKKSNVELKKVFKKNKSKLMTKEDIPIKSINLINNQLINTIIQKDKKIEELDEIIKSNKNDELFIEKDNENLKQNSQIVKEQYDHQENYDDDEKPMVLILNNTIIQHRNSDGYIDATQLCKAGGKKFSQWYRLESTKELISALESDVQICTSLLIDKKKGNTFDFEQGTWIHPDLAIQLAQWISPIFALQVSNWIRNLFTKGKVEIDLKILKEKENLIKTYQKRISLLENMTLKKHKRTNYQNSSYVVYLITNKYISKDRIYIIGKTIDLKSRLVTYNKSTEHEVIYYKSFKNEKQMDMAEDIILNKLDIYKEQANRERVILPPGESIKLFTDVFDTVYDCFN